MYLAAALRAHGAQASTANTNVLPSIAEDSVEATVAAASVDSTSSSGGSSSASSSSASVFSSGSSSASSASSDALSSACASNQSLEIPLVSSPVSDTFTPLPAGPVRRNEHLAVLIPKYLWKPDSEATLCDTFVCRKRFTLFERKHHCRKCGGVFCGDCSTRSTDLLDVSKLDFVHPPKGVPISHFASPKSPVSVARVCDDCYEQIHGWSKVVEIRSAYVARCNSLGQLPSACNSASSLSSVATPPEGRPPMRRSRTSSSQPTPRKRRISASSSSSTSSPRIPTTPTQQSWGQLDAYPLRNHSSICKATGGGRWTPKPIPVFEGVRVPFGKAPFEIEMEREAEEERLRRLNPVISDGGFRIRVPKPVEPVRTNRPLEYATF